YDPEASALAIVFTNMVGDGRNVRLVWRDRFEYQIPLSIASRKGDLQRSPSEIALGQLRSEARFQQRSNDEYEQSLAADAAFTMLLGQFSDLAGTAWEQRIGQLNSRHERLHRLYTEPWRRWATGFSCFFFVIVGAPLAIKLRNADVWTSFFVCFCPILLIYYPLLMYGVDRAKCGALPPYAVWAGNIVLGLIGLYLIHRVKRN